MLFLVLKSHNYTVVNRRGSQIAPDTSEEEGRFNVRQTWEDNIAQQNKMFFTF